MASSMQTKSSVKGGKKLTFHGGSPDAVKRDKPKKGKGKKKTMRMK